MLQMLSITFQGGRQAGVLAAIGILLGGLFQIVVVALGAAALMKTSPVAYAIMKAVGGAYLVWLGVQRMSTSALSVPPAGSTARQGILRRILWSSALIEASNPKSALFYLSFLLPFCDPASGLDIGWQLLLLGLLANLLFSVADLLIVMCAHLLRARVLGHPHAYRRAQRTAGLLFILMGVFAVLAD